MGAIGVDRGMGSLIPSPKEEREPVRVPGLLGENLAAPIHRQVLERFSKGFNFLLVQKGF